jgi:hypothetical protein
MPETPAPSSRMVDEGVRREEVARMLVEEESQDAKRGVTFQTTVVGLVRWWGRG